MPITTTYDVDKILTDVANNPNNIEIIDRYIVDVWLRTNLKYNIFIASPQEINKFLPNKFKSSAKLGFSIVSKYSNMRFNLWLNSFITYEKNIVFLMNY